MRFEEFREQILSAAAKPTADLRELEKLIEEVFRGKALPYFPLRNMFIVRSSMHSEDPDDAVFKNISRCSYPPDSMKEFIKIQRANYPGQQVFYCTYPSETTFSSASGTCTLETAWEHIIDYTKQRIYATLTRWELQRPLHLWVIPFSEKCIKKNTEYKVISENFKALISQANLEDNDAFETLKFFSEVFSKKEQKNTTYKITSAFYNYLLSIEMKSGIHLDGLLYPSANTEGAGLNLVLKKDLIDTKILNCSHVVMWSLQRDPNDPMSFTVAPCSDGASPDSEGNFHFSHIW